jgi:ribonuclease E
VAAELAEPVTPAAEASVPVAAAESTPAPQPDAAAAPVRAAAAPVPTAPYVLPTQDLQAVASGAGLEWVGSDADKVAAVQAAMAAEPKPIHVPREPKPRVMIDDGPLVLVETKKDLSQMKLPFEQQRSEPPAAV